MSNASATSAFESMQVSFFYYIGIISTAFGSIKLAIHALRTIWEESVDVVEDTSELAHLVVRDVKQIYNGEDPRARVKTKN
jgi:hypothetical protein